MHKIIRIGVYINIAAVVFSNIYVNVSYLIIAIFVAFVASNGTTEVAMKEIKEDIYGSVKKWADVWFSTFMLCFFSLLMLYFNVWIMIKKYPFVYTGGELHYRQKDMLLIADGGMILFYLFLYLAMLFISTCSLITAIKPHYVFGEKIFY